MGDVKFREMIKVVEGEEILFLEDYGFLSRSLS